MDHKFLSKLCSDARRLQVLKAQAVSMKYWIPLKQKQCVSVEVQALS